MKLTALHISGFGVYHAQTLRDIPSGLTVLHGANEAGKSTLLAFLRAAPYGFEQQTSRLPRYEPLEGGSHGGWVEFAARDGREFRLERQPGRRQTGELTLTDLRTDASCDASELDRILGAQKETFFSVYAFSIAELQGLESLTAEQVKRRIWSAGMGQGDVPVADIEQALNRQRDELYTFRSSKRPLNSTLADLRAVRGELREAQARSDEHEARIDELDALDAEATQLAETRGALQRRIDRLEQYEAARPVWQEAQVSRERLEELGPQSPFPTDGVARLERLLEKRDEQTERVRELTDQIRQAELQLEELTPDTRLTDCRKEIEGILGEEQRLRGLLTDLSRRKSDMEAQERSFGNALRDVGHDWGAERLQALDTSQPVLDAAQGLAGRIETATSAHAKARDDLERASDAVDAARREAENREAELAALQDDGAPTDAEVRERREALPAAREALAKAAAAEAELAHLSERKQELSRQSEAAQKRVETGGVTVPAWLGPVVGVVLAAATVALRPSAAGIGIGLAVGVLVAGVFLWIRRSQASSGAARADEARRELDELERAAADVESRRKQALVDSQTTKQQIADIEALVGVSLATAADVERAAQALDDSRERLRQAEQASRAHAKATDALSEAEDALRRREQQAARAASALEETEKAWRAWLAERGLAESLTRDGFLEIVRRCDRLNEQLGGIDSLRGRIEAMEADSAEIANRAHSVWAACGRESPELAELPPAIGALGRELGKAQKRDAEARAQEKDLARLRAELERSEAAVQQTGTALTELLARADAADEETFRRNGAADSARSELREQIRDAEGRLAAIDRRGDRAQLEAELAETGAEDASTELAEKREEHAGVDKRLAEVNQELGGLRNELSGLESSADIADCLQRKSTLEATLVEQLREFGTLSAALKLLQTARNRYEQERQPLVIQRAGRYMERITGGRYTAVLKPMGEDTLRLLDSSRTQKGIEALSRGTQQQLYLAMRLAYVSVHHQSPTVEPLPLIMDEVLINFDPERCRRTAELILEVAETEQVFLFTCHPETVDLFRELDPDVPVVTLEAGTITAGA